MNPDLLMSSSTATLLGEAQALAPGQARHGWSGSLRRFTETQPAQIVVALQMFVTDAGPSPIDAGY